ncbi:ribonuclease H2 subunit C [Eucyclogobius newberryi]|uniref:ribonuclease H2 subunit C n=1 Tax=Eucyclogobius newberryi TaxID=166745 RepID=UPI003B5C6D2E
MSCSSSVIQLQLPASGQAERAPVHLLPCELEHNGPAQIMEYFCATVKDHKPEKTVSFRGRELKGQEVSCPQRCTGLVLKEVNRPGSEEEDRTVRVTSVFDKLTYWNLETPPSSDDTIVRAMDWPELAEAIHGPVD